MFLERERVRERARGVTEHVLQDVHHEIVVSYLVILGEEFGEFLIPPLRCFFFGDKAVCWSSSTGTKCKGMRSEKLSEMM